MPSLQGLRSLPALRSLDLSTNSFAALEGPWEEMPNLEALDVTSNRVDEAEGVNVRLEVIICHKKLQSINGEEVTEEELEEATALEEQRAEEERARLEAEEEARRE